MVSEDMPRFIRAGKTESRLPPPQVRYEDGVRPLALTPQFANSGRAKRHIEWQDRK